MMAELSKLEMGASSSSSGLAPAPSAPAGAPGAGPSTAAAAALPPPPPAAAASGRLAGLPPAADDDWAPPGQPAPGSAAPPPPPPALPFDAPAEPAAGGSEGGSDGHHFELPSPPKQRPIETQHSRGAWVPPPPRRFQTFQKASGAPAAWPSPFWLVHALLPACGPVACRSAMAAWSCHAGARHSAASSCG